MDIALFPLLAHAAAEPSGIWNWFQTFATEHATIWKWFQIILADLVLAGDNALVIALATRSLGKKEQFWGRLIGTGGAVGLRILFIFIIGWLLKIPYLQLIAGLLLLWIAWKLLQPQPDALEAAGEGSAGGHGNVKQATTLREAIWVIIMADITMSLDNVIAIANIAQGDMTLVVFGLLLSIPLVVWGSSLIAKLMTHQRWIVWLGGAVLGHVAGGIVFHDTNVLGWMGVSVPADIPPAKLNEAIATAIAKVPLAFYAAKTIPWALAGLLYFAGWYISKTKSAAKA